MSIHNLKWWFSIKLACPWNYCMRNFPMPKLNSPFQLIFCKTPQKIPQKFGSQIYASHMSTNDMLNYTPTSSLSSSINSSKNYYGTSYYGMMLWPLTIHANKPTPWRSQLYAISSTIGLILRNETCHIQNLVNHNKQSYQTLNVFY